MKRLFITLMLGIFLLSFTSAIIWDNIAYYALNETTGAVVDSVGLHNGVNNAATQGGSGKISNGYDFSAGSGSFVNTTFAQDYADFSVSFWFKTPDPTNLQKLFDYTGEGSTYGYKFCELRNSKIQCRMGSATPANISYTAINTWTHVVAIRDSSIGKVLLYVNGTLVSNDSIGTVQGTGRNGLLGSAGDLSDFFTGSMDEVGIWNRVLTSSEVSELWNSSNGAAFPGLQQGVSFGVNLVSPTNNTLLATIGTNFTVNFNISTNIYNWANATYKVWLANGTQVNSTFITLPSVNNTQYIQFIDDFSLGDYYWNVFGCYANSTFNNCTYASTNSTFSVGSTINNQSYNNISYETSKQTFNITVNLLEGSQIALAKFIYNNVTYAVSDVQFNGTSAVLSKTIDLPLNNNSFQNQTNTFYWQFTYNGGQVQTLTSSTQNVGFINLQICNNTYNTKTLNFTFFDEINQTNINATANPTSIQSNFRYWLGSGSIYKNYSFQNLSATNNSYQLCIFPNINMSSDADLIFSAQGYLDNNYYWRNATISNITNNILLYLLQTAEGTKFNNQVQQGVSFISGAVVNVQKYFIGLGTYITTAIKLTDDDGKFPMFMDLDSSYRFAVTKEGVNLGQVDKSASCASSPCGLLILLPSEGGNAYDGYNEIYANKTLGNITFNPTNKIVTYNFNDLTGLAAYFKLQVSGYNYQNDSTILCTNYSYSTYGTMTCNLSNYTGDFLAEGFVSRSPEKLDPTAIYSGLISDTSLGLDGLFLVMGLIITVVFAAAVMSKGNPSTIIFCFGLSILALKLINLMPFSWILVATLEAVIFYLLMKLKV